MPTPRRSSGPCARDTPGSSPASSGVFAISNMNSEALRRGGGEGLQSLAERYGLQRDACEKLGRLLELLVTDELVPTAIRDPRRVLEDHVADSLVALELAH